MTKRRGNLHTLTPFGNTPFLYIAKKFNKKGSDINGE